MHERLSFYIKRDSVIHDLNPLTKLTLVLALILIAFVSPWYWTPHLLVLIAIIPLSFLGKVSPEFFRTAHPTRGRVPVSDAGIFPACWRNRHLQILFFGYDSGKPDVRIQECDACHRHGFCVHLPTAHHPPQ